MPEPQRDVRTRETPSQGLPYIRVHLLPYRGPLQELLRSFTDHVARGEEPEITGADGYRALKLCEATPAELKDQTESQGERYLKFSFD